jgi:hypothetical protein
MTTYRKGERPEGRFDSYRKTATTEARQEPEDFVVETKEGVMTGRAGDYLCLDNEGDPYPCARSVFEASYEPAASEEVA